MMKGKELILKIQEWGFEPEGCDYSYPISNTFLYFICDENAQYLKIGISKDPEDRLKNIQTGNPLKLILLLKFYATPQIENKLHSALKKHQLSGEWYSLVNKKIVATLKDLCLGYFCGMSTPIYNYVYALNRV